MIYFVQPALNTYLKNEAVFQLSQVKGVNPVLIEFSARLCYNTLGRLGTAPQFVKNVLEKGHLSVAEHGSFYIRKEQERTERGDLKPWLHYKHLFDMFTYNRFISLNQNAIFGNIRALSEAMQGVRENRFESISSVLHVSLPELFEKFDVPITEIKSPGFYVEPKNGVSLIAFNVGSMIEDDIKSVKDRYKWSRYTFLLEGISRNCSHQIARHRGASISQESQRYVDSSNAEFSYPPDFTLEQIEWLSKNYGYSMAVYEELRKSGAKKEDARFSLPSGINTRMVISFDYRDLLSFLNLRCDKHSQWEIRNIALEMLRQAFLATPTRRTTELKEMYDRFLGANN